MQSQPSALSVLVWAPNLVDYLRIALATWAFALLPDTQNPWLFLGLYLLNFVLDGLDGVLARRLDQTSSFGAFLDVAIDNTVRTLMWHKAMPGQLLASVLPCVEWLVLVCTHGQTRAAGAQAGAQGAGEWKASLEREEGPWWARTVMAHGFRNPAGCLAVAGLHFLPLWIWARSQHLRAPPLAPATRLGAVLPLLSHPALGWALLVGRLLALSVELWVLASHAHRLLREDAQRKAKGGE